jgi:hypothetical protein
LGNLSWGGKVALWHSKDRSFRIQLGIALNLSQGREPSSFSNHRSRT